MRILLVTLLSAVVTLHTFAQAQFIAKGRIEFEKKTNLHKQMENMGDDDNSWKEMLKKSVPQTKTSYFDLYFNDTKTLYTPGREIAGAPKVPEWMEGPATDNVVFTDLGKQSFSSQKTVFENVFNISDTVRKVNWKITADTRTIAGFECRKATTIVMDSVFVVAFFTEQILTPGGPESFAGLPGMILGLAVPRMHTTWFATKLELVDVKETMLAPPKKGKKTTIADLKVQLNSALKDWGRWRDKNLWQIMI